MSARQKRVSLTQEQIRILRNTKQGLPDEIKNNFLFGFLERFGFEVMSRGVAGFKKQAARSEAGVCPRYRPKGYNSEERAMKKLISKRSWYKPFFTILFCSPYPNSQLAVELRKLLILKQEAEAGE